MIIEKCYTPNDCDLFPLLLISCDQCPECSDKKFSIFVGWLRFAIAFHFGVHAEDFDAG